MTGGWWLGVGQGGGGGKMVVVVAGWGRVVSGAGLRQIKAWVEGGGELSRLLHYSLSHGDELRSLLLVQL